MKKILLVLLMPLLAATAVAEPLALDWKCGAHSVVKDNLLIVSVERNDKQAGTEMARAEIDISPYCGKMVEIKAKCLGFDIAKARQSHHGSKLMLHYRDLDTNRDEWPQAGTVIGTFGEREIRLRTYIKSKRVGKATLSFGLQFASGTFVMDLSTLEISTLELSEADAYQVKYPQSVMEWPRMRGVMSPSKAVTEDDMKTLQKWGANLLRFQMNRGWSVKNANRDIEDYMKWLEGRLDNLEQVLGWARDFGIKVVVDLHTPAGGRGDTRECNLFFEKKYEDCFYDCWRKIATRFKGRPEIYGYDLINEPVQHGPTACDYMTLQRKAAEIVRAIDPDTPIVVESNEMDAPQAFWYLKPLKMDNIIYQVHVYCPGTFTHQLGDKPKAGWNVWPDPKKGWTRDLIREELRPVREFQRKTGCRIYVGEFSAVAWAPGADAYLRDCIALFEEYGWDWSYHAFREYAGWSVEHEGEDSKSLRPANDTPRMKVLLDGFRADRALRAGRVLWYNLTDHGRTTAKCIEPRGCRLSPQVGRADCRRARHGRWRGCEGARRARQPGDGEDFGRWKAAGGGRAQADGDALQARRGLELD